MKTHILLLAAAYLNAGAYVDAGETVRVGDKGNEITAERAAEIVRMRRADEVDVEETDGDEGDAGDDLTGKTVAELKKVAADEEVELGSATTKAAILEAIRKHRDEVAEG